jgi:replicative DNA helicase
MLMSKDAIADVVEILGADDFYQPKHGIVFDAILDLYGQGEPADMITVASALVDAGDINRIGGAGYLHTLVHAVPTAANAGYYARIVADRAKQRRLIESAARIGRLGWNLEGRDVDDAVDEAQQMLFDLGDHDQAGDAAPFSALLQPALDEIEAIAGHDGALRGISSGYSDMDRLTNGFLPGQLILVAARPGIGKSVLCADLLRECAIRQNLPCALFALEMSSVEVTMRLLSAEARIPLHTLRSGKLSDDDWTTLARRMGEISEAPLFCDDSPNLNLMEMRAKARRLKQRHDIRLIVVDYLQLMSSPRRAESRQQEVAEISRGLKLLAKEIGVPIVAACQLNRGSEQRSDKRPQLSDLRESGSLEQDADIVILLHREDYYDKESSRAGEADLILAKHRAGPTETVTVAAQLHLARFVDMAIQ